MSGIARLAAATLLLAATGASAQAAPDGDPALVTATINDDDTRAIDNVLRRGTLLYRYDQAAWHSTDALRADVPQEVLRAITGWVVIPASEGGLRTIYYGGEAGAHFALYSAVWTSGTTVTDRRVHRTPEERTLDHEAVRLIGLRDTVSIDALQNCSPARFNIVILPASATGDSDSIYLLSPQVDESIPFGGHHRIDFSEDREIARRAFTNSCVSIPSNSTALAISHFLDPIPTEIHIFSMYAARRPVYVQTSMSNRTWVSELSGGEPRIRLINRPAN